MYLLDGSANRTLIPIAIGRASQRKSNQGSDAGLIIFLTIFKLTYFQICVFIPLPYLCGQNNPDTSEHDEESGLSKNIYMANVGKVKQIIGAVIDVQFNGTLPDIYNALELKK